MIDFTMRLGFVASAPMVAAAVRTGQRRGVAVSAPGSARVFPASNP